MKYALIFLFIFSNVTASQRENFLLINGSTEEVVMELGSDIYEQMTPCSTFKIALCLMGMDASLLKDENAPTWEYQEGYDDYLEVWKNPQTPQSWMTHSCLWYSKLLSLELGLEKMQNYVDAFEYGNLDLSGGLDFPGETTVAWVNSSLKISPKEQVNFIQKIVTNTLPISKRSLQLTRDILFKEELQNGWKLYGKTGMGSVDALAIGWFVGWIEKGEEFYPFAYNILDTKIDPAKRIPRVKEFLNQRFLHIETV